ncbi:hypothetical protein [Mycobacteroides chelonae]|uniref:hypothetical protein n=1 Tax=Mycobacteroides chelonae TaxID=1774 RepID=UPI001041F597|nr:hypothetical protein [Mycobacteroides chelonae]
MTMIRSDYNGTAGMHKASSADLSCADLTTNEFVPSWTIQAQRRGGNSQPSRFRSIRLEQPSARSVGVCPDRKLGPEEQSHTSLTFGVCAARNVA